MGRYEAAVFYDFTRHRDQMGNEFPLVELAVDLDQCRLGLCRCEEQGAITLLEEISSPQNRPLDQVWLERLAAETGAPEEDLRTALTENGANQGLWNYYRAGHRLEGGISLVSGFVLSYRQADEAFLPVRSALTALLEQSLEQLERRNLSEDAVRILAFGWLADCAPAQLVLRETLSFDPFLPDRRFAALGPEERASSLADEGQRLLEQSRTAGLDVSLLWIDENGQEGPPIPLVEKQQPVSALSQPRYCSPVFVAGLGTLRVRVGNQIWESSLPDAEADTGGLVEAACILRAGQPVLLFRRTQEPNQVFEFTPAPQGGEIQHGGSL